MRKQRANLIFAGLALLSLVSVGGHSYAQMRELEMSERDERRAERRVEALQRDHDALRLNIETRLTKIETQMGIGIAMLSTLSGVIGIYLVILIGKGAREWIHERRPAGKGGASDH